MINISEKIIHPIPLFNLLELNKKLTTGTKNKLINNTDKIDRLFLKPKKNKNWQF